MISTCRWFAATLDKFADAHLRIGLGGFDVLVIDESYQADTARYYTAAALAPTHLLVGDSGQLNHSRHLTTRRSSVAGPKILFRLPSEFYCAIIPARRCIACLSPVGWIPERSRSPSRSIRATRLRLPSNPGSGNCQLNRPGAGAAALASVDQALDEAAGHGWAHVTLPGTPVVVPTRPRHSSSSHS